MRHFVDNLQHSVVVYSIVGIQRTKHGTIPTMKRVKSTTLFAQLKNDRISRPDSPLNFSSKNCIFYIFIVVLAAA